MPNPASSGTGYFDVTAWLHAVRRRQRQGGGWKYMDALHENIAQYTHSGSKPCNMAGTASTCRHLVRVPRQHQQGQGRADRPGVPEGRPGLGPRGVRHPQGHEEARARAEARRLGLEQGRDAAVRQELRDHRAAGVAEPLPNVPADYEKRLVKMDFKSAADNRERILAEWTKRYDAKSEPK
jgi:iron(III) transport system substrate-binding protein